MELKSTRVQILIIFIFSLSCLIAGCSMRIADFTICTTRNVNLDRVDLDTLPQQDKVEGFDKKFIFLFIPFGFPHLETAVDDALDKGNGDVMVDTAVYSEWWWFIVGQTGIKVRGTVVKTRGN